MHERVPALLLAFTLTASAIVWAPLISVYFVGDDFLHLFAVVDADLGEYLLRPHGGHILVARNAVFVAFHTLFGMRADLYFWAVLLTHLLNTFLLFRIVSNWTGSAALAAFGALLWSVCPTHAGTLAWYSVYGQVLVGTILLVILHQISRAHRTGTALPRVILIVWPLLFIVASTCFGVGIGLTLVSPIALYLLLPPSRLRLGVCLILALIAVLTPTVYKALILYHDELIGSTNAGWAMAVAIGALQYRWPLVLMFGSLIGCGISDLLLSFGSALAGFPSIPAIIATVGYGLVMIVGFALAPPRMRFRLIGLLLLVLGSYGVIAAGRATLLPSTRVAVAAATTRYHYVGTIPLSLLLSCALASLTRSSRHAGVLQYGLLLIAVALGTALYVRAKPFIDPHLNARKETKAVVEEIRAAIARAPAGSEVHIETRRFQSVGLLLRDVQSGFPGWAGIFTLFFPDNVVDGKRVRFVLDDPIVVKNIATGKRSRDLFVVGPTPAAAPAGAKPRAAS